MRTEERERQKQQSSGYRDQEELIDVLSESISTLGDLSKGMIVLHLRQSLIDCLEKRGTTFKKIRSLPPEEKETFINELVINTVKRAKLVGSVDKIIESCNSAYDAWKKKNRPE
ncbi:MAG TPA: hypothetical protein PK926_07710 [Spirochaetota bacterium]|nr:hypothetical protein [Spirochaetota bacterium]HPI90740.1 hypothetical protein [Spirochaetota bacterium]HPR46356.1 hypothetical protein [Spirochaetota bacterium]